MIYLNDVVGMYGNRLSSWDDGVYSYSSAPLPFLLALLSSIHLKLWGMLPRHECTTHFCPPRGALLGNGLPRFIVCQWQVFLADVFKAQAGVTYFFHTSCQLTVKQGSRNALRAHFADMTQPRWRLSLRIECTLSIWLRLSTSTLVILSCHLMCRILRKHRKWKLLSCFVCLTLYI